MLNILSKIKNLFKTAFAPKRKNPPAWEKLTLPAPTRKRTRKPPKVRAFPVVKLAFYNKAILRAWKKSQIPTWGRKAVTS
jgi:hypothetical protein